MGWVDHLLFDSSYDVRHHNVKCDCGAVYRIRESDGVPGSREIETFECRFCGKQLASHFGDCSGELLDDSKVSDDLKNK